MKQTATETTLLRLVTAVGDARSEAGPPSLAVVERKMTGGEMPVLHVHEEDEAFYVIEGRMTIHAGNETVRLEAGDVFLAPKRVPHTYRADSQRVRYLAVAFVRSVGGYEDFLHAVGAPPVEAKPSAAESWPGGNEVAALSAMASANRISVLGPPGALPSTDH